jgi:RNA polymerase sigma factor (sigma-70 family)
VPSPFHKPRDSYVPFPSTAWTLIRHAQELPDSDHAEALGELFRRYWKPMYAFFRSKGKAADEAQDLVQGFLQRFLERGMIHKIDQPDKRFRHFLMVCARRYMLDEVRKEAAAVRSPRGRLLSFEDLRTADGNPFEPRPGVEPEQAFDDAWRRDLLARALRRVHDRCLASDRLTDLLIFQDYYLVQESEQPTWARIADRHGVSGWKKAAHRAEWVKGRLAEAIRDEIRQYVESEREAERELRELLG